MIYKEKNKWSNGTLPFIIVSGFLSLLIGNFLVNYAEKKEKRTDSPPAKITEFSAVQCSPVINTATVGKQGQPQAGIDHGNLVSCE